MTLIRAELAREAGAAGKCIPSFNEGDLRIKIAGCPYGALSQKGRRDSTTPRIIDLNFFATRCNL